MKVNLSEKSSPEQDQEANSAVSITALVIYWSSRSCIMGEGGAEWGYIPFMNLRSNYMGLCMHQFLSRFSKSKYRGNFWWFIPNVASHHLQLYKAALSMSCPSSVLGIILRELDCFYLMLYCEVLGSSFRSGNHAACWVIEGMRYKYKVLLFVQYIVFWWLCLSIKILHSCSLSWG